MLCSCLMLAPVLSFISSVELQCVSTSRTNDGSLCEIQPDLWGAGLVPYWRRSRHTRVWTNTELFTLQSNTDFQRMWWLNRNYSVPLTGWDYCLYVKNIICDKWMLSTFWIWCSSLFCLFPCSPPRLMSAENYTLFIKNSVTFPLFDVIRWWPSFISN